MASQIVSVLIQGSRNRDMTFNAGADTAPGHKGDISSRCFFSPSASLSRE